MSDSVEVIQGGWKQILDPRLSKLNWLLLLVPVAIYFELNHASASTIFITSLIAIMPLAWLMGKATEEIALRVGQGVGAILNASFGNAAELIIAVFLIIGAFNAGAGTETADNLISVVQASLIGSVIGNLLLVLGIAFIWGGFKHKEQSFSVQAVSTNSSLLMLAILALIIPAIFSEMGGHDASILSLSRAAAIILIAIYSLFLLFQLRTHSDLFVTTSHHEDEMASMTLTQAALLLVTATVLTAMMAEFLVGSIEAAAGDLGWPQVFIGVILLPLFGNAAEHFTAVVVAGKNKMDLSIGIAIGSSTQIAVFVAPLTVMLGWALGVPMTLEFGMFATVVTFLAVLITNIICADGKSNWLEGVMLIGAYMIIGAAFWLA